MHIDQLQLFGPIQKLSLNGYWQGGGPQGIVGFSMQVDSKNLGELAQVIGYGAQLKQGNGNVKMRAMWHGTPENIDLSSMQGRLSVDAHDGQLSGIDPGAGRVLSLLSITQLPRRLTLDFRDLFSKGLAFNSLTGSIDFGGGKAKTQAITINGPAATIVIRGRANLSAETLDQIVDVNPRSGNLLTVVGAVAGGPVGAAVGAAANAMLSKPLSEIGARRYHLTGHWNTPKVEVITQQNLTTPEKNK